MNGGIMLIFGRDMIFSYSESKIDEQLEDINMGLDGDNMKFTTFPTWEYVLNSA
jgi:hypothetical protein